MILTSFSFLLFFPVVFLLHYCVFHKNVRWQNLFILIASCIFYGCWDWKFLGLLMLTSLSTFIAGRCMEKRIDRQRRLALIGSIGLNVGILFVSTYFAGWWMGDTDDPKSRKWINVGAIVLNMGILFFFKYFNFFVESFVDLFALCGIELNVSTLKILLPVGISFYTFTALSYTIDVYQKKIEPTRDWLAYLCYVTFFPSILSGPINRATKQLPQFFQLRTFNYGMVASGTKMLVWGLFVKLCVADRLGIYVDTVYGSLMQHTGVTLFVTSVVYTLQIYADFSGYSLMAIGLGKMLGIELQTNFIRPYLAKTVTDFWRRWHVSLTTWFRDYIYFPLGGNRCSQGRWMLNTMIVFVVSGLWHGAAYTFLIWGAFHGLCMIVEKQVYGDRLKHMTNRMTVANGLRMCLTFMVVNFAWIFFRLDSFDNALYTVEQIATLGGVNPSS